MLLKEVFLFKFLKDEKDVQFEPSVDELRQIKRAVRMNSVIRRKSGVKFNRASALSSGTFDAIIL